MKALKEKNNNEINKQVKPFLKWAGGKGQLISAIEKYYPFNDTRFTKICLF